MAASKRVVRHAVFSYTDPKGVLRTAVRGDTIELSGDELERAERFEAVAKDDAALAAELDQIRKDEAVIQQAVFGIPAVAVSAESSPAGAQSDEPGGEEEEDEGDDDVLVPPKKTANKAAWLDYRVKQFGERGLTAELVEQREVTTKQLQDDAFVEQLLQEAAAQPPAEQTPGGEPA